MATLSTEQSAYIKSQQQYLANLKTGQFAKFLDKNPIYVTYYVINQAQSTTDAGTGAIYEEIGPNSSIRFNKVNEVPAFNIPELKPDVINDEGGYDIEMDINDIAFIPGTVRPKPGDYMRVDISGTKPLLFRCNVYNHNSIKSNDYYLADFDLIDIGGSHTGKENYLVLIEKQVEETYQCKFANIGTNQKVLVSDADQSAMDSAAELVETLSDFYNDAFYNADVDGFVLYDAGSLSTGGTPGLSGNGGSGSFGTQWYCDNYLTRFINESKIFENQASDYTTVLPYLELIPLNFDYLYSRTVWNAILTGKRDYIYQYMYAWSRLIQKRTSPLMLSSIPTLHPSLEMLDHYVKPEEPIPENLRDMVKYPGQYCGWAGADPMLRCYFSSALLRSLATNAMDDNLNAIEKMIFQYVTAGVDAVTYTKNDLLNFAFKQDLFTYMHMPIVIYILKQHLNHIGSANS